jgi:hypothetical protein
MLFKKHENKLLVTSNLFDHGRKLYRCLDLTAYEEGEGGEVDDGGARRDQELEGVHKTHNVDWFGP